MLVSFVILHYQSTRDTIECIDSIFNNVNYNNFKIILIDNCSPNHSGNELKEIYKNNNKIEVILNNKNLGFAKGNNVGFLRAKEMNSDFIIMMNNDTVFNDKSFINEMINIYKEEEFGLLGPDILSLFDSIHQNPSKGFPLNHKSIKNKIFKLKIGKVLNYFGIDDFVKRIINTSTDIKNDKWKSSLYITSNDNYVLHGSCLIFGKPFIERFDGLYDKTFMYYEENILCFMCTKENIKQLYSPKIRILHKGKSATNIQYKTQKKKRAFYYKQSINSISVLLDLFNNYGGYYGRTK